MQTSDTSKAGETFTRRWHILAALRIYGELASAHPDALVLYRALTTDEEGLLGGRDDIRALPEVLQPLVRAEVVKYAARAAAIDGPTGAYALVQCQAPASVSYFAQFDERLVAAHQAAVAAAIRSLELEPEPSLRNPVQGSFRRAGATFPALWTAVFLPVVDFEALVQRVGLAYLAALREAVEGLGYPTLDSGDARFEIQPTDNALPDDVAI